MPENNEAHCAQTGYGAKENFFDSKNDGEGFGEYPLTPKYSNGRFPDVIDTSEQ